MKITEFFVKRPTLFWSLMIGILLAGVFAFTRMPKLEDPAVAVKQAMVMVPYMGASAVGGERSCVACPMCVRLQRNATTVWRSSPWSLT